MSGRYNVCIKKEQLNIKASSVVRSKKFEVNRKEQNKK